MHIQNVPRQNVPRTKRPTDKTSHGQNVPREKTSKGTKRLKGKDDAHDLTCVANYLIQKDQGKGMTEPNLPIVRTTQSTN